MMRFVIEEHCAGFGGIRFSVADVDGSWRLERLFLGYPRRRCVDEMKKLARSRFGLKKASFTVYA